MTGRPRLLLALASVAVAFAAADTYVVVLALPDMMTAAGVPIDELQRGAPIVSGFLLGYVAMLPLIGRVSDLRGRVPVLVGALVLFALGSFVTALAYDLPSMVTGRFLQGVGGGGLVPATLALVADLYPVHRRGVPLGLVSAVQELGSVAGPLLGAAVLALASWRGIFLLNLAVALVLAVALSRAARQPGGPAAVPQRLPDRRDWLGAGLAALALGAAALVLAQPPALMRDLTWGALFVPFVDLGRWGTPLGALAVTAGAAFLARCLRADRPLVDLPAWWRTLRAADLTGSMLLAAALAGVILAFATADPEVQVFAPAGPWLLLGSATATAAFALHLGRARDPLVPHGALRRTPAWGSLLVSFFVGCALIAALIDIPLFARTTVHADSQLGAALVLVQFLIAIPVGAVVGGALVRRAGNGPVAAAGMALAAIGFWLMSRWDIATLEEPSASVALVVGGLGFGLALAPVSNAVLAATDPAVHGLASALVVVARMVGMLVGISALTTIGLRRYYAEQRDLPAVQEVCDGRSRCAEFTELLQRAGIVQEQVVFQGAALCALVAGLLALALLRTRALR